MAKVQPKIVLCRADQLATALAIIASGEEDPGTPRVLAQPKEPASKFGRQDDGSFWLPPRAAAEFHMALNWLGRSESKNFLGPTSPSIEHLRHCAGMLWAEANIDHEEYT